MHYYIYMWAAPCEKVYSGICGQRRPRSACASSQSDQGLRCPLTESLDTIYIYISMEIICPDETLRMRGMNLNVHFAHARRHIFAWRGPPCNG